MQIVRGIDPTGNGIDETRIEQLVRGFYAKIRVHERLGPIFAERIADDDWESHLNRMMDFWSSLMLTTGRYSGRPMPLHLALKSVRPEDFDIWLKLFEETALSMGGESFAAAFMDKARRVATSFKYAMFFDPAEIAPRPAGSA